jgi:hypothetical protein
MGNASRRAPAATRAPHQRQASAVALAWLTGRHERRVEANAGRGHERCVKGNRSAAP